MAIGTATLVAILVATFLIWYAQFRWRRRRMYELAEQVPGPPGLPLIGNAHQLIGNNEAVSANIVGFFENYPDIAKIWFGPQLFYLVSNPEYFEVLLNHPKVLQKSIMYKYTLDLVGRGLFAGPVPLWKRHRKILSPALNQTILNCYHEIMSSKSRTFIKVLQDVVVDNQEIDIGKYMSNCTTDIITETIFGVKTDFQQPEYNFRTLFDNWMDICTIRLYKLHYQLDFIFKYTKDSAAYKETCKQINAIIQKLIDRKIQQLDNNEPDTTMEQTHKKPLMMIMLEKLFKKEFTEREVQDHSKTFLIAGSDTTGTSTCFVLLVLALFPDVQQKVYEEVLEIIGPDRPVEHQDLPRLQYTDRVIKETLRLFPGGAVVTRHVEDDVAVGGITIPKGATVAFGYLPVQRSHKYWPNPLKFDPDRFLPENSKGRHPYTWLPFSGGLRNCIGFKYADMTVKTIVADVVRYFTMSTAYKNVEDVETTLNIVVKAKHGYKFYMKRRR